MTKQDYTEVYAGLLDDNAQRIRASIAFSQRPAQADLDPDGWRDAVKATQERAAQNQPPLPYDTAA